MVGMRHVEEVARPARQQRVLRLARAGDVDSTLALPPCQQIDWIRGVAKVPPLPCSPARARDHSAISND